jgi:hypothetical protein
VRGVPARGRRGRRRAPRRGLWLLPALVLVPCVVVAAIFLRGGEGPAETAKVAAVGRPASAGAPEPPADPARARALAELDERLGEISRAHPGTHGAVVFDPLSGETASLNAASWTGERCERQVGRASLSRGLRTPSRMRDWPPGLSRHYCSEANRILVYCLPL